jgi:hypothetical protein
VGEALVSFLDEKGRPAMVERAFIVPPASRLGPLSESERRKAIESSLVAGHYEKLVDRESAYEKLTARAGEKAAAAPPAPSPAGGNGSGGGILDQIMGGGGTSKGRGRETAMEAAAKSAARAIGSEMGRRIIRGVLGSILGGRR